MLPHGSPVGGIDHHKRVPEFCSGDGVLKPYLWMLAGCVWFSAMSLLAKDLGRSQSIDWQLVVLVRSATALTVALISATVVGAKLTFLGTRALWLRSLAGSTSMILTFYALGDPAIPASDVSTICNTFPLWVAILSWPMIGDRPTWSVLGASLLAVAGVAQIGRSADHSTTTSFASLAAQAAFGAAFFTAVAMIGLNRIRGVSTFGVVAHFSLVATLVSLGATLVFPRSVGFAHLGESSTLLELLGVGTMASLGQICLTVAFRSGNASRVAVVGLTQVVIITAFEVLAWSLVLTHDHIVGMILVLAPTAWIMVSARKPNA